MILILTGHHRSGTSLLTRILQSHPEINLTSEFANFKFLGWPLPVYSLFILQRAWKRGYRKINGCIEPRNAFFGNLMFAMGYNFSLLQRKGFGFVDFESAASALEENLPKAKVIGDKYPDYVFYLDRLLVSDDTKAIVIFRDPRDVTASTLLLARGRWKGRLFTSEIDTAKKVARRWVHAMEMVESMGDRVLLIKYEDLVSEASRQFYRIAKYLKISSEGFVTTGINPDSIGKFKNTLSLEELEQVCRITSPMAKRYGYFFDN
jgi:hypothetical protein